MDKDSLLREDCQHDAEQDRRQQDFNDWMRDGVKKRVIQSCIAELSGMSWDELLDAISIAFPDTHIGYLNDYKTACERGEV